MHCCPRMEQALDFACDQHDSPADCPDTLIRFSPKQGYGLWIHDGSRSFVEISFCPWCGSRLEEAV